METPEGPKQEEEEDLFDEEVPFDISTDESHGGLDDELASDLEIGSEVEELAEGFVGGEPEAEWEFGNLIPTAPDDGADASDDDAGPAEFDHSIGLVELRDENLDDASVGIDDGEPLFAPAPADVADDDEPQELFRDWELELPDESRIPDAVRMWQATTADAGRRLEALCATDQHVLAGGDGLLVCDADGLRQTALPSGLIALRACPGTHDVLAVTRHGEIWRLSPPGFTTPVNVDYKSSLAAHESLASAPQLTRWSKPQGAAEFVALTANGKLLSAGVADAQFRQFHVPRRVSQLPLETERPLLLSLDQDGAWLLESEHSRGPWRERALPHAMLQRLQSGPFCWAEQQGHVVFGGPYLGLVVSRPNTPAELESVPGCVGVTAIALGERRGSLRIWAALSHEISGSTDLVQIDADTLHATRVARFESTWDSDFAPVRALVWHAQRAALYAAGEFGLYGFEPGT